MQHRFTVGIFMLSAVMASQARAFVPNADGVAQKNSMRPPKQAAVRRKKSLMATLADQRQDGSVTFLGSAPLHQSLRASDVAAEVLSYFAAQADDPNVELSQVSYVESGDEVRVAYVQTVQGVPIAGTFAMAQVKNHQVHYARHFLVTPPNLNVTPSLDADQASLEAAKDVDAFAQNAQITTAPTLTVVYDDAQQSKLVWQVNVQSNQGIWEEYVDAHTGAIIARHKASMDAVDGNVTTQYEASCEGETPVTTGVPFVQWTRGWATDANGHFNATKNVAQAQVQLNGAFVLLQSYDNNNLTWVSPLQAAPRTNDIALNHMPLSQIDPYMYVNQARSWVRSRAATVPSLNQTRLWPWTNGQTLVRANLPSGYGGSSCNAFYDTGDESLNFFVDFPAWGCNNSGRSNKIVYHEYGHGIHDHLRTDPTFDHQVSEGVADFTMASITNDPNVTGLVGCKNTLRSRSTWRTCINHYTYCDSRNCDSFPGDEEHNSAPIICGALWETRSALIAQYGESAGTLKSDQFFLRFLTLVQDMDSSYSAAIAADEDNDGNPSNGTVHSCAINQAFLGDGQGGFAHFPGLQNQRVPCVR